MMNKMYAAYASASSGPSLWAWLIIIYKALKDWFLQGDFVNSFPIQHFI